MINTAVNFCLSKYCHTITQKQVKLYIIQGPPFWLECSRDLLRVFAFTKSRMNSRMDQKRRKTKSDNMLFFFNLLNTVKAKMFAPVFVNLSQQWIFGGLAHEHQGAECCSREQWIRQHLQCFDFFILAKRICLF